MLFFIIKKIFLKITSISLIILDLLSAKLKSTWCKSYSLNVDEIDIRGQFHPAFMPADPKSTVSFCTFGICWLKNCSKNIGEWTPVCFIHCCCLLNIIFNFLVFQGFGQAKFAHSGLVEGSSQFSILPHLPPKTMFNSKVVKIDPKITLSLC